MEDEANSNPVLMDEEIDYSLDLTLALKGYIEGPKASALSRLSMQADFTHPDPSEGQIVALAQMV